MGSLGEKEKKNNKRKQNEKQQKGKKGKERKRRTERGRGDRKRWCKSSIKQGEKSTARRKKNTQSSERQEHFSGTKF